MPFTTYVLVLLLSLPILAVTSFIIIKGIDDTPDLSYLEKSRREVQHTAFGSLTICTAVVLSIVLLIGPGIINGANYIDRMNTLLEYQESYVQSTGAAKEAFRKTCRNLSKELEYDEQQFSVKEWDYIQHTVGYDYSVESLILPELRDMQQED